MCPALLYHFNTNKISPSVPTINKYDWFITHNTSPNAKVVPSNKTGELSSPWMLFDVCLWVWLYYNSIRIMVSMCVYSVLCVYIHIYLEYMKNARGTINRALTQQYIKYLIFIIIYLLRRSHWSTLKDHLNFIFHVIKFIHECRMDADRIVPAFYAYAYMHSLGTVFLIVGIYSHSVHSHTSIGLFLAAENMLRLDDASAASCSAHIRTI